MPVVTLSPIPSTTAGGPLLFGPRAVASQRVDQIDPCRVHLHAHFAGAGMNLRQVDDLQHLGATVNIESDRTHRLATLRWVAAGG